MMDIYTLNQIETPRLIIRPVRLGDEYAISEAIQRSLSAIQRWMPWANDPSFETTQDFVRRADAGWRSGRSVEFPMVVILKSTNQIISATGYNERSDLTKPFFEIGFWIDHEHQGHGYVTEFVNALTRFALTGLKATRVQICTQYGNVKAINVIKRCGYNQDAVLRNFCVDCISNEPADSLLFSCCDVVNLPGLDVKWSVTHREFRAKANLLEKEKRSDLLQLPILQTERLTLKPPEVEDVDKLYDALISSVNEVHPWFSWAKPNLSTDGLLYHINEAIASAKDVKNNDHFFYLVWDAQGRLLGEVWVKVLDWSVPVVALNYWFDTRETGNGYATEALSGLIRYCQDSLNAKRIEVRIAKTNTKSLQVAKRLNFVFEGNLRNYFRNFVTNEIVDGSVFSIVSK